MATFAAVFEILQDRRIGMQKLSARTCELSPTQHTPLSVFHILRLPDILRNPVRDRTDWSNLTECHLMLQLSDEFLGKEQLFAWMNCLVRLQTLKLALDGSRVSRMPAIWFVHGLTRQVRLPELHTFHLRTTTREASIVTDVARNYGHTLKHLHFDLESPGTRLLFWIAQEIQNIDALLPFVETFRLSFSLAGLENHYEFCLGHFQNRAERLERFKGMAKDLEHFERTIQS